MAEALVAGEHVSTWDLRDAGPDDFPELREIRRTGDQALRNAARTLLFALGGPEALGEDDLSLFRRLIRSKIAVEVPVAMESCEFWYAIPTTDQAAVLDAFGLSGPEPVTMSLGTEIWRQHYLGPGHQRCARVYVSPALDGWTLIFGSPSDDQHPADVTDESSWSTEPREHYLAMLANEKVWRGVLRERCVALSRRFGEAHHYFRSYGDSTTSWCIAENGELVRFYDVSAPEESVGELAAEHGYLLPHEDTPLPKGWADDIEHTDNPLDWQREWVRRYRRLKAELGIPDHCDAETIAEALSVHPGKVGPHTRVEGHGVIALTGCGRRYGHPRTLLRGITYTPAPERPSLLDEDRT
ncbi:hypothetical protein H074_16606 [Amycolatopsis decaplanina DSM 44594]|uniref:Uncharacterized protein n=1 Tax=Amycolatopsis decaplanina DSM 44594 TaxID=1284240 RepID=M2YDW5_9PSEU|nr:hypothetical protein H074_16606 [Amycolatopsis decaplanina DSM 44594]